MKTLTRILLTFLFGYASIATPSATTMLTNALPLAQALAGVHLHKGALTMFPSGTAGAFNIASGQQLAGFQLVISFSSTTATTIDIEHKKHSTNASSPDLMMLNAINQALAQGDNVDIEIQLAANTLATPGYKAVVTALNSSSGSVIATRTIPSLITGTQKKKGKGIAIVAATNPLSTTSPTVTISYKTSTQPVKKGKPVVGPWQQVSGKPLTFLCGTKAAAACKTGFVIGGSGSQSQGQKIKDFSTKIGTMPTQPISTASATSGLKELGFEIDFGTSASPTKAKVEFAPTKLGNTGQQGSINAELNASGTVIVKAEIAPNSQTPAGWQATLTAYDAKGKWLCAQVIPSIVSQARTGKKTKTSTPVPVSLTPNAASGVCEIKGSPKLKTKITIAADANNKKNKGSYHTQYYVVTTTAAQTNLKAAQAAATAVNPSTISASLFPTQAAANIAPDQGLLSLQYVLTPASGAPVILSFAGSLSASSITSTTSVKSAPVTSHLSYINMALAQGDSVAIGVALTPSGAAYSAQLYAYNATTSAPICMETPVPTTITSASSSLNTSLVYQQGAFGGSKASPTPVSANLTPLTVAGSPIAMPIVSGPMGFIELSALASAATFTIPAAQLSTLPPAIATLSASQTVTSLGFELDFGSAKTTSNQLTFGPSQLAAINAVLNNSTAPQNVAVGVQVVAKGSSYNGTIIAYNAVTGASITSLQVTGLANTKGVAIPVTSSSSLDITATGVYTLSGGTQQSAEAANLSGPLPYTATAAECFVIGAAPANISSLPSTVTQATLPNPVSGFPSSGVLQIGCQVTVVASGVTTPSLPLLFSTSNMPFVTQALGLGHSVVIGVTLSADNASHFQATMTAYDLTLGNGIVSQVFSGAAFSTTSIPVSPAPTSVMLAGAYVTAAGQQIQKMSGASQSLPKMKAGLIAGAYGPSYIVFGSGSASHLGTNILKDLGSASMVSVKNLALLEYNISFPTSGSGKVVAVIPSATLAPLTSFIITALKTSNVALGVLVAENSAGTGYQATVSAYSLPSGQLLGTPITVPALASASSTPIPFAATLTPEYGYVVWNGTNGAQTEIAELTLGEPSYVILSTANSQSFKSLLTTMTASASVTSSQGFETISYTLSGGIKSQVAVSTTNVALINAVLQGSTHKAPADVVIALALSENSKNNDYGAVLTAYNAKTGSVICTQQIPTLYAGKGTAKTPVPFVQGAKITAANTSMLVNATAALNVSLSPAKGSTFLDLLGSSNYAAQSGIKNSTTAASAVALPYSAVKAIEPSITGLTGTPPLSAWGYQINFGGTTNAVLQFSNTNLALINGALALGDDVVVSATLAQTTSTPAGYTATLTAYQKNAASSATDLTPICVQPNIPVMTTATPSTNVLATAMPGMYYNTYATSGTMPNLGTSSPAGTMTASSATGSYGPNYVVIQGVKAKTNIAMPTVAAVTLVAGQTLLTTPAPTGASADSAPFGCSVNFTGGAGTPPVANLWFSGPNLSKINEKLADGASVAIEMAIEPNTNTPAGYQAAIIAYDAKTGIQICSEEFPVVYKTVAKAQTTTPLLSKTWTPTTMALNYGLTAGSGTSTPVETISATTSTLTKGATGAYTSGLLLIAGVGAATASSMQTIAALTTTVGSALTIVTSGAPLSETPKYVNFSVGGNLAFNFTSTVTTSPYNTLSTLVPSADWSTGVQLALLAYSGSNELITDLTVGIPVKWVLYAYNAAGALIASQTVTPTAAVALNSNTWSVKTPASASGVSVSYPFVYYIPGASQSVSVALSSLQQVTSLNALRKLIPQLSIVTSIRSSNNPLPWMWISILNPAPKKAAASVVLTSNNYAVKTNYTNVPTNQFEQSYTFYGNPQTNWANANPITPIASNVNWNTGVTYVLLGFNGNNFVSTLSSAVTTMYLFMFDAATGSYLGNTPCPFSSLTGPAGTTIASANWTDSLAIGFQDGAQSAGINAAAGYGTSYVIGQYPVAFTILGPQSITLPQLQKLSLNEMKVTVPSLYVAPVKSTSASQPAWMSIAASTKHYNIKVDNVSKFAQDLNHFYNKNRAYQFFNQPPLFVTQGSVISLTTGSITPNWSTGVTLLLLGFDGNNNYISDVQAVTPTNVYLFMYDTKTGNLISSTSCPLSSMGIWNGASWGDWIGLCGSTGAVGSPANMFAYGTYPTAFTIAAQS